MGAVRRHPVKIRSQPAWVMVCSCRVITLLIRKKYHNIFLFHFCIILSLYILACAGPNGAGLYTVHTTNIHQFAALVTYLEYFGTVRVTNQSYRKPPTYGGSEYEQFPWGSNKELLTAAPLSCSF